MMNPQSIHETSVIDILDFLRTGIDKIGSARNTRTGVERSGSISKATSGLTLVFPTLCSTNCSIEDATIISKALERRNISLLQMAFSAYNITNCGDAISHLQKFHTNISNKVDLDTFIDTMDALGESAIKYSNVISAIAEDCKRNINFTFNDDINPKSLLEFKEVTHYGSTRIIKEAPLATRNVGGEYVYGLDGDPEHNPDADGHNLGDDTLANNDTNKKWNEEQRRKDAEDQYRRDHDVTVGRADATKEKHSALASQLVSSEVKKANEMQPSLMVVNFYVNDSDRDLNIAQQVVAGVKSKLYPISSNDIIHKIITKHVDGDLLLKLVKVSTREISFVKDFLLGIDDAKLDSLNKSRRSSSSAMFKALERRALKGKVRKSLRMNNTAKAIASLVVTMEEVEELKKYQGIDVTNPKVVIPIMEKLCLLNFVIVDSVSESIMLLEDGATEYEQMSLSALERDNGDSSYKKVVNLMTKIAR